MESMLSMTSAKMTGLDLGSSNSNSSNNSNNSNNTLAARTSSSSDEMLTTPKCSSAISPRGFRPSSNRHEDMLMTPVLTTPKTSDLWPTSSALTLPLTSFSPTDTLTPLELGPREPPRDLPMDSDIGLRSPCDGLLAKRRKFKNQQAVSSTSDSNSCDTPTSSQNSPRDLTMKNGAEEAVKQEVAEEEGGGSTTTNTTTSRPNKSADFKHPTPLPIHYTPSPLAVPSPNWSAVERIFGQDLMLKTPKQLDSTNVFDFLTPMTPRSKMNFGGSGSAHDTERYSGRDQRLSPRLSPRFPIPEAPTDLSSKIHKVGGIEGVSVPPPPPYPEAAEDLSTKHMTPPPLLLPPPQQQQQQPPPQLKQEYPPMEEEEEEEEEEEQERLPLNHIKSEMEEYEYRGINSHYHLPPHHPHHPHHHHHHNSFPAPVAAAAAAAQFYLPLHNLYQQRNAYTEFRHHQQQQQQQQQQPPQHTRSPPTHPAYDYHNHAWGVPPNWAPREEDNDEQSMSPPPQLQQLQQLHQKSLSPMPSHTPERKKRGSNNSNSSGNSSSNKQNGDDSGGKRRNKGKAKSASTAGPAGAKSMDPGASKRVYTCPHCQRSYDWNYNLNRHLKYECGKENAFQCAKCGRKFPHKQNCVYHLKRKHKIVCDTIDQYMAAGLVLFRGAAGPAGQQTAKAATGVP